MNFVPIWIKLKEETKMCELDYIEKNGLLYPRIQISDDIEADVQPVGKYGMMWLNFMKEHHLDRYNELKLSGKLMRMAHEINVEAHNSINFIMKTQKNLSIERLIVEQLIIRENVLIYR